MKNKNKKLVVSDIEAQGTKQRKEAVRRWLKKMEVEIEKVKETENVDLNVRVNF